MENGESDDNKSLTNAGKCRELMNERKVLNHYRLSIELAGSHFIEFTGQKAAMTSPRNKCNLPESHVDFQQNLLCFEQIIHKNQNPREVQSFEYYED